MKNTEQQDSTADSWLAFFFPQPDVIKGQRGKRVYVTCNSRSNTGG